MHRLAPAAGFDLDDIWVYVANESGSFEIADKIVDAITERFWLISCHPHKGVAVMKICVLVCEVFRLANMSSSTGFSTKADRGWRTLGRFGCTLESPADPLTGLA